MQPSTPPWDADLVNPDLAKALTTMKTLSAEPLQKTYWYWLTYNRFKHLTVKAYSEWVDWILGTRFSKTLVVLADLDPGLRTSWPFQVPTNAFRLNQEFLLRSFMDIGTLKGEMKPYLQKKADTCSVSAVNPVVSAGIYFYITKNQKRLGFPAFLFGCMCDTSSDLSRLPDEMTQATNVQVLFQLLAQSRLYFMIHRRYLPLLISYQMLQTQPGPAQPRACQHSTACVYLPYEDPASKVTVWYRIFIDTSGVSFGLCNQSFNRYASLESEAFQKYQATFSPVQWYTEVQIVQIFCIGNVQRNYGTCSHWSTLLSLLLIYEAPYVTAKLRTDSMFLNRWFSQLVSSSDQHMDHFLGVFLQLRQVFYQHFMHILRNMATLKKKDIAHFFAGVLYGRKGLGSLASPAEKTTDAQYMEQLLDQVRTLLKTSFADMDRIIHLRTPKLAPQVEADVVPR